MKARAAEQKPDKSLSYFHGEAASSAVENAAIAYQTPSLIACGASDSNVSLMNSLVYLAFSVLLLKIPSFIEAKHPLKNIVLILSIASSITWLPIVAVLVFFPQGSPLIFMLLWMLSLVPSILIGPLRDSWLAGVIPAANIGRYLSLRSTISSAVYLSTFLFMGYMLDFSQANVFQGFAAVFSIACMASCAGFLFYRQIHSPQVAENKTADFNFVKFLKETRSGHLGTFIIFVSLLNFSVHICNPLFAIYMLDDLRFSYLTFTVLVCIEYIARVASLMLWGKYADKTGIIKNLGIACYFIPVIPVLWLFSSNFVYLAVAQIISGSAWAIFDLCSQAFIYRASPQALKMKYVIYYKSFNTFFISLGALAGAYLINVIFPVFGSKILGLFLFSGVLRFAVVKYMLPKLRDTTIPFGPLPVAPDLNEFFKTWIPRYAIFHHLQDWSAVKSVAVIPMVIENKYDDYAKVYQPFPYLKSASSEVASKNKARVPNKQALYYRRDLYNQQLERQHPCVNLASHLQETTRKRTINKLSYLYQSPEWAQLKISAIREAVKPTKRAINKQSLYYQKTKPPYCQTNEKIREFKAWAYGKTKLPSLVLRPAL
jgi:hypothetical protein